MTESRDLLNVATGRLQNKGSGLFQSIQPDINHYQTVPVDINHLQVVHVDIDPIQTRGVHPLTRNTGHFPKRGEMATLGTEGSPVVGRERNMVGTRITGKRDDVLPSKKLAMIRDR